ncbi:alcohol dehydrogenase zinc-binding domain-containing protein [Gongronella butleri]|nr:alcohol dehydrogenase zinc-binding domain-containing protein [Gongronella butleri]
MKAAVLKSRGPILDIEQVAEPELVPGTAIVKVLAVPVVHYLRQVLAGDRPYPMMLPMIPGCSAVGIVERVAADAGQLRVGDMVFCDPTIRARDNPIGPQTILQGLMAPDGGLSETHRHGSFAERLRTPLENVFAIPPAVQTDKNGASVDPAIFVTANAMLVAYGGLLEGEFAAGQTLLLLGGSGFFGSTAIVVAMALGARKVIVPTRNPAKLDALRNHYGSNRLVTIALKDDDTQETNIAAFQAAAAGAPIDMCLDFLDQTAPLAIVTAAVASLRVRGTLVLMGGNIGNLELPYMPIMLNSICVRGCFMYPPTAGPKLFAMIEAGLIDLTLFDTSAQFKLPDVNDALKYAEANAGTMKFTIVKPN